ncbi:Uncharacterised protein [Vibrio cholerae]|nr:Uncharacterised protein [Vibrio cholerae]
MVLQGVKTARKKLLKWQFLARCWKTSILLVHVVFW